ncbi:transglycosylase domain-containing protein [Carboxylicivirga mesophila]|uniref:Transglycosylase domain-containing protein n=1 Tax=Carboxylicivirga mesophila TaxID=1166478 RepID=A0ABS5K512_9BACT|nr:transglycosylase domain-containing protein [Carboxylicivirga mesophila]MBS2210047.1 transglycosylase domain-containing protein [Carboxylicivirga mesophila]
MEQSKSKYRKLIRTFWILVIGGILSVFLLFTMISYGLLGFMPTFEELENPKSNLATNVISSDHQILGNYFRENRSFSQYEELSPNIVNALVATEDVRFYDHSGIDARGLARVIFRTIIMQDQSSGGGSTITQQLAKLLFHGHASSNIERAFQKLKEWVIAVKLERSYTKDEILTMYLNKAEFIYDAYGIKSAAKTFFNTSTDSIKVEEAAVIIGMLKNPALFNPVRRPELTQDRRNVVLNQMLKAQFLTQAEYDSISVLPLELKFNRADHKEGPAPYFREYLRLTLTADEPTRANYPSWMEAKFLEDSARWVDDPLYGWIHKNYRPDGTQYDIYKDGLRIYTTIDSRLQQYAEDAVKEHLSQDLQPKFFNEKKGRSGAPYTRDLSKDDYEKIIEKAIKNTDRYRALKRSGADMDSVKRVFNTPYDMTVFTWAGERDTVMTPLDSIHHYKFYLRAGMISMDPLSGHVKAYVGGPNFKHFMYDMAGKGKRQVGSTIKPFVYTLAMQEGFTPCDLVPNIAQTFYLGGGKTWTPRNSGSARAGEMVTLKWGLANSNNNITAWVMKQFNPEAVANTIHELGIKSPMDAVPALCLGTPDFGLLEMTSGYCTFANKGVHIEPMIVTRIEDRYGNVISDFHPQKREAISEQTAYLMLNLLEGVINQGTGIRLRLTYELHAQMGGKTGTTQNHSDGWFMGVTPQLVTGIWVGGEERDIHFDGIRLGQGANMALPIFALYMKDVYANEELGITEEDIFEEPLNFNINIDCGDNAARRAEANNQEEVIENVEEFF